MKRYRLKEGGKYRRFVKTGVRKVFDKAGNETVVDVGRFERVAPGDEVELTDDQARSFSNIFQPIHDVAGGDDEGETEELEDVAGLLEGTVKKVAARISKIDDVAFLAEVEQEEIRGANRKGVLGALATRADELEEAAKG